MSGSSLTNLLGTLVNLFYLLYTNEKLKLNIDLSSISILGDDIVFASNKLISFNELNAFYETNFKQNLNIEKSEIFKQGEKVYFLGHYFDSEGRYLNRDRLEAQLCFSENYIPEDVMSTSDRVWSKFCSLLFKCSDGYDYFLKYKDKLLRLLKLDKVPDTYFSFYDNAGEFRRLAFNDYAQNGWMNQ